MNLPRVCFLGLLGLCASLLGLPGHAADSSGKAEPIVWEMVDIYRDFETQHRARRITPEQVAALADKAAAGLADQRDDLAKLLPKLDPQSRFSQPEFVIRPAQSQWNQQLRAA